MTQEQKDIIESLCVNEGYLQNWYMDSVGYYDDPKLNEPVWTDEHLEELFKDFYLIPKEGIVDNFLSPPTKSYQELKEYFKEEKGN